MMFSMATGPSGVCAVKRSEIVSQPLFASCCRIIVLSLAMAADPSGRGPSATASRVNANASAPLNVLACAPAADTAAHSTTGARRYFDTQFIYISRVKCLLSSAEPKARNPVNLRHHNNLAHKVLYHNVGGGRWIRLESAPD